MAVVVIAEDDIVMADFMGYSFTAAGHTVHVALDGHEALRLVRSLRPNLVVLDHDMPGLTGVQVAEALRAMPGGDKLIVVMITGTSPQPAAGLLNHVFAKPLRPRQIARLCRELLG